MGDHTLQSETMSPPSRVGNSRRFGSFATIQGTQRTMPQTRIEKKDRFLYVAPLLDSAAELTDTRLASLTERHGLKLPSVTLTPCSDLLQRLADTECTGAVVEMLFGWPGRRQMLFARRLLRRGKQVFFYWPKEEAVEYIDYERLGSYWRLWFVVNATRVSGKINRHWSAFRSSVARQVKPARPAPVSAPPATVDPAILARCEADVSRLIRHGQPVPFRDAHLLGTPSQPIAGTGVYLRTDYWAQITSGGSYTHTCFVARELQRRSEQLIAFMPYRYELLDMLGVRQVCLPSPSDHCSEQDLLAANAFLLPRLRPAIEALHPAYIYERLCPGNYVGAMLSRDVGVPYIVEYNGSEISMSKSFSDECHFKHEQMLERIEEAAFHQATLISVVSAHIKQSLIRRGIPGEKILVNPNGVDTDFYQPAQHDQKAAICRELGWPEDVTVLGFTGTFGAWHGIDVLAAALPRICHQFPQARFLLIGDGTKKHLVDEQVELHHLQSQVACVGRVPQAEGRRLLGACDIYLAPHSAHMVDSKFFGSPTKVFEYMAQGGGIVASELEQIGQVLSPALRPEQLANQTSVGNERAILFEPGNVEQLVDAVTRLIENPQLCSQLGANARQAAEQHYTWKCHIDRLWRYAAHGRLSDEDMAEVAIADQLEVVVPPKPPVAETSLTKIDTGDRYKDEVQAQWNDNPCGSHYSKEAQPHTLEWYLEIENHRYCEYAPWMPDVMEFANYPGKKVLEIGAGLGTDLAQFAIHGARVTDVDLAAGHLAAAQENFRLRGLAGEFIHHDAESLPLPSNSFDVVYTNGVIHHTPNTRRVIDEMYRVLKPGGRIIVMVYAENSLFYWNEKVIKLGVKQGMLFDWSIAEIMSQGVERTSTGTRPLVKVYTRKRLRNIFRQFDRIEIVQRQLTPPEVPVNLQRFSPETLSKVMGWNLILKAHKPASASESTGDITRSGTGWTRAAAL